MKKYTVLCAGLCMALAMTSCKTNESAYSSTIQLSSRLLLLLKQPPL